MLPGKKTNSLIFNENKQGFLLKCSSPLSQPMLEYAASLYFTVDAAHNRTDATSPIPASSIRSASGYNGTLSGTKGLRPHMVILAV